ncbi:Bardet-Biedl syndrome 4 protein [Chytriomyces hyalinus]|nr:Bardet-Biedl syndrome 4 protein [Chytriomyces hyalinus]
MIAIVNNLLACQRYTECSNLINRILSDDGSCTPETRDAVLFASGLLNRHQGRVASSVSIFKDILSRDPFNVNAMKQLARSTALLGDHASAIEIYNEALNYSNSDWDLHHKKALSFKALDDLPNASVSLLEALKFQCNEISMIELGKIYIMENKFEAAKDVYETALRHFPNNVNLIVALGLLHVRVGDVESALKYADNVQNNELIGNEVQSSLADIYQEVTGENEGSSINNSLRIYQTLLFSDTQSSEVWNNIGRCLQLKTPRKPSLASISSLKHAVTLGPLNWTASFNLGVAYLNVGQLVSAFVCFSLSASLNPRNVEILERVQFTAAKLLDNASQ